MERVFQAAAAALARRIGAALFGVYALRVISCWGFAGGLFLGACRWWLGAVPLWAWAGVLAPLLAGGLLAARIAAQLRRPDARQCWALLDWENQTGGLLSALGADGVRDAGWGQARELSLPAVQCSWKRPAQMALAGLLFAAGCLWLPLPASAVAAQQKLNIGPKAAELKEQIELLEKENLVQAEEAKRWQEELARVTESATGQDPAKTWEALDYLKEALSDKQTAALQNAAELGQVMQQAETAASALESLAQMGAMSPAEQAGAELGLKDLLEKSGGQLLPPELRKLLEQAQAAALTPEQLRKLQELLRQAQGNMQAGLTNLMNARMLTPEELKQLLDRMCSNCNGKGGCTNGAALAASLCAGQKNGVSANQMLSACQSVGNGGPGGGGGAAALTWSGNTQPGQEKFKAESLPPASLEDLKNAQAQGISYGAAQEKTNAAVTAGTLAGATAGASRQQERPVLPRHKRAVENYFERGTSGGKK